MAKPWHRWPPALRSNPPGPMRAAINERDGWDCAIALPGCTHTYEALDHIIPPEQGGSWWGDHNLRSACTNCNNKRRRGTRWANAPTNPVPPSPLW